MGLSIHVFGGGLDFVTVGIDEHTVVRIALAAGGVCIASVSLTMNGHVVHKAGPRIVRYYSMVLERPYKSARTRFGHIGDIVCSEGAFRREFSGKCGNAHEDGYGKS
jgi:hypothetical protein